MDTHIRDLLRQITSLEDELRIALHEREERVLFTFRGKRIEFAHGIHEANLRLRRSFLRWLTTDRPQNLLTGPLIYGMAVPLAVLDTFVTLYQALCFPIYGIAKVRRADYIVFDRHQLGYLNFIERLHCEYCAYASGLIAYAAEVTARTEQYFCPIKHARKILGAHSAHARFMEFGDSTNYHARVEAFRCALAKTSAGLAPPSGPG